jgi:hypothetical protein
MAQHQARGRRSRLGRTRGLEEAGGCELSNDWADYEERARAGRWEELLEELHAELHAIKLEIMGGEDAPGSASAVTLDDVKKEIERLRGIEAVARSLAERYFFITH